MSNDRTNNQSNNQNAVSTFSRRTALKYGTLLTTGLVGSGVLARSARAATITVDDSGGVDYTTIQDAVNNASDGDTIQVAEGSYGEMVNVDKSLVILGDSGTFSDRGPGGAAPSTEQFDIDDPSASGTTISGFELTGTEEGIDLNVGDSDTISNISITDNKLTDTELDMELDDGATLENVTIQRNHLDESGSDVEFNGEEDVVVSGFEYIDNIVENGSNDLVDIDLDESGGGYDVEMLVSCNDIQNGDDDGIEFELDDNSSSVYDLTIYNNVIDGVGNEGIEFLDNGSSSLTATIIYNKIINCSGSGIRINDDGDGSGITIENNVISGNGVGLEYDDSEVLDARNNYWGAADGPSGGVEDDTTGASATGSGDEIEAADGAVRFDPFLTGGVSFPDDCLPTPFQEPITALGREIGPPLDPDNDGLFEDVTGDEQVDARDQRALEVILSSHTRAKRLGLDPGESNGRVQRLTDAQIQTLDFNGDGEFDRRDVAALGRQISRGTAVDD